jgi:hypothetical protein
MRKWYVGDAYDNFDSFESAVDAGCQAEGMIADGLTGVYILHLTEAEFQAFCMKGIHIVGLKT